MRHIALSVGSVHRLLIESTGTKPITDESEATQQTGSTDSPQQVDKTYSCHLNQLLHLLIKDRSIPTPRHPARAHAQMRWSA